MTLTKCNNCVGREQVRSINAYKWKECSWYVHWTRMETEGVNGLHGVTKSNIPMFLQWLSYLGDSEVFKFTKHYLGILYWIRNADIARIDMTNIIEPLMNYEFSNRKRDERRYRGCVRPMPFQLFKLSRILVSLSLIEIDKKMEENKYETPYSQPSNPRNHNLHNNRNTIELCHISIFQWSLIY